jgi:hypothetical protein
MDEMSETCGTHVRKEIEDSVGKSKEKRPLERPKLRWKITLIWAFKNIVAGRGLYSDGIGQAPLARSCDCGDEHSTSIKCREFLVNLE